MNVFDCLFLILFYLKLTNQIPTSWAVVWGSLVVALTIRSAAIKSTERYEVKNRKKEEKLNEIRKTR